MNHLRVAFLVNNPYINTFIHLHEELNKDKLTESRVYACDSIEYDFAPGIIKEDISTFLFSKGVDNQILDNINLIIEFNPHFIFTSNPYDMYRIGNISSKFLCSISRLSHISYGASLLEWVGPYQVLNNNEFYENAHSVFTESKSIFKDRHNFFPIGYTKLDSYLYYGRQSRTFDRFSILWKPRWTTSIESGFEVYIHTLANLALCGEIVLNILIHPFLFSEKNKSLFSVKTIETLDRLRCCEFVNFVDGSDFLDYVLGSDIFIGDASSTLAEFLSTEKPIIYTGKDRPNALGELVFSATETVSTQVELEYIIGQLRKGIDHKVYKRKGLFNKIFEQTPNISCSIKIKQFLIDSINNC